MKYSQYNTIFRIENEDFLIYNSISDKFLSLNRPAKENMEKNTADHLYRNSYDLYKMLQEIGAVIEDQVDETLLIKQKIDKNDNDDSFFDLHMNPTVDCNFRCWYCYEDHVKGSKMGVEVIENIEKLTQNIISNNKNLKTLNVSFFGGEPLMYFKDIAKPLISFFDDICGKSDIKYTTHFTSNGFLLTDEIIAFLKDKNCTFQITLDGYKEYHDKVRFSKNGTGSFDKIVANIKRLITSDINVQLRINYTVENIAGTSKIADKFEDLNGKAKENMTVDFQRVWQDSENEDISEIVKENIACFTSKGYQVTYHSLIDRVNNSCYGDKKNHLLVNYNGDVFKCTARDFTTERRAGYLNSEGIIVWNGDYLCDRMSAKFSRKICHTCRIAPLCGGGCTQRAIESQQPNACLYNYTDEQIDKIILDRFEFMFINNQ